MSNNTITTTTQTFLISLQDWEQLMFRGYQGFDPAYDCTVLNYDEDITDGNYLLEIATSNIAAANLFESEGFIELL